MQRQVQPLSLCTNCHVLQLLHDATHLFDGTYSTLFVCYVCQAPAICRMWFNAMRHAVQINALLRLT